VLFEILMDRVRLSDAAGSLGGPASLHAGDWFVSARSMADPDLLPLLLSAVAATDDATAIASLESFTRLLVKHGANSAYFWRERTGWYRWLLPMLIPVPDDADSNSGTN
jgi:hypothetical protein